MKILGAGRPLDPLMGTGLSKILLCRYATVQKDVQKKIQNSAMTQILNNTMAVPGFSGEGG